MPTHLVPAALGNREELLAFQLLREFRRAIDDDSFAGAAIFSAIGLFAGLVGAIFGNPGVWM